MKKIFFHLKKLDWPMVFAVFLLVGLGFLLLYSSSRGNFLNLKKQVFFFFFGFFLMLLFSFIDWRPLKESTYFLLFFYLLSLFLLFGLFFFAPSIRGTKSWYKIGFFSFDPTELTKIVLLFFLAKYFSSRHVEMYRLKHILISGFYVSLPCLLIFFQPNLGSVLILLVLWLGILFLSGIKLRHFFLLIFVFLLIFLIGWKSFLKEYQKERILSFLSPKISDPFKVGWSQRQTKIAIGSGGIFGQGIKKGSQTQLGFLPEPQTDFIFSVLAEETGLFGVFLFLLLFLFLVWRILKIALESKSNFPRLFCGGFAILLVSQTFIHLGMNLGLLPIVGIPLPFLSYGGSGLIFNLLGLGIIQSFKVYR
jgi:rod shape determining protein RodA